jgi:hypothetical protein
MPNTLIPGFDTQNPANKTAEFPMRVEYFGGGDENVLRTEITQADTKPRFVETSIDQLRADAENEAVTARSIVVGSQYAAEQPRPVENRVEVIAGYRTEIANAGPAVTMVRRSELSRANPEQRDLAQLS